MNQGAGKQGRRSVRRPDGAPRSYACPGCDIVLYDGVDYLWCPICLQPVDWIDLSEPLWCCDTCDAFVNEVREDWPACIACECLMSHVHALESPPPPPSPAAPSAAGRVVAGGFSAMFAIVVVAQVVVLALDPLGLVVVAPFLVLAVIGAGCLLIAVLGSLGELRAIAGDRGTRVVHGLEHACLKLLERQGRSPLGGRTHRGFFELEIVNDGRASVHAVRQAAMEAMIRVASGEASLALDPRCGTSLLIGAVAASAVIVIAAIAGLLAGVPPGVLAACTAVVALLAWWGSRPLGLLAQRVLTVSTEFTAATVQRIVRVASASGATATFLVYVRVQLPEPAAAVSGNCPIALREPADPHRWAA